MKKIILGLLFSSSIFAAQVTTQGITDLAVTNGKIGNATITPAKIASTGQNTVLAGPTSGSGVPSFRTLVAADIPSLSYAATDLSNLTATAINMDLLPGVDTGTNLGSQTLRFLKLFAVRAFDNTSTISVDIQGRVLDDSGGSQAADWQNRNLKATDGTTVVVDWGAFSLDDSATKISVDWNNRLLFDSSGATVIDFNNRQLQDNTSTSVMDWTTAGTVRFTSNIRFDTVGTRNIGTTNNPAGNVNSDNYFLTDNFGNQIGSIVEVNTGIAINALYAVGGTFVGPITMTTANNASGPSGSLVFAPGTASTGIQGQVHLGGHIISDAITTTPAVSACGTSPSISGTDAAGKVTIGTGVTTSCTITFGQVFSSAPHCFVNTQGVTSLVASANPSTTNFVINFSVSAASDTVDYFCVGN